MTPANAKISAAFIWHETAARQRGQEKSTISRKKILNMTKRRHF